MKKLLERRAELVAQMQAMVDAAEAEDRDLTTEEAEAFDALSAELDSVEARITRASQMGALAQRASEPAPSPVPAPGPSSSEVPVAPSATPGPEAAREFDTVGEFLAAVARNPSDQRLATLYAEHRMDTGSTGGFMVPEQFRDEILSVPPEEAIFRPRSMVLPAGTPPDAAVTLAALDQDSAAAPDNTYGGVQVNWTGEGGEKPESPDAEIRQVKLEPQEVTATFTATDKLLRNWTMAGSFLTTLFRQALAGAQDRAFFNGDGVSKPLGAIHANNAAVIEVTRAGGGAVDYADLLGMIAKAHLRGGALMWLASQSVMPDLMTIEDTAGNQIWAPNAQVGPLGMPLLGFPIRFYERSPLLGSRGDVVLINFGQYLIKDGSGPFVAASEHVKFTQNKTVFKVFMNTDGQPWLKAPYTQESGEQVSPFVALN